MVAIGQRLTGTVTLVPIPGRVGIFIDLGLDREGFVDVLRLPDDPDMWPVVGTETEFEVVAFSPAGAIRLRPVDPRYLNLRGDALLRPHEPRA